MRCDEATPSHHYQACKVPPSPRVTYRVQLSIPAGSSRKA